MVTSLVRKAGRTAQVYIPRLQDLGKSAEGALRKVFGRLYTADFEGIRFIDRQPGALYVDIGANRGAAASSIWALDPQARVVAFEPNRAIVDRFGDAIRRRGGALHAVALSNEPGELTLFVPVYRGVVFDGLASLDQAEAANWLGPDRLFAFDKRNLTVQEINCPVATLDSYGLDPFFVKIDVQGKEYEVLSGALETLKRSEPIIFTESDTLDFDRTLAMLSEWNYTPYWFDGHVLRKGFSKTNVYLVPASKTSLLRTFPR